MRGQITVGPPAPAPSPERQRGTMQFEVKAVTMVESAVQAEEILARMYELGFIFEEVKLAGREYETEY